MEKKTNWLQNFNPESNLIVPSIKKKTVYLNFTLNSESLYLTFTTNFRKKCFEKIKSITW